MEVNKTDTKTQIFNAALRLFASNGYENVSIRAIADAVGIKTASLYYHYSSKEDILEACYYFYMEHRHKTRLTKKEYEPIIRNGTQEEILSVLNYSFPENIAENMILSLLTIFSRIYTDPKAKEIYANEINCSMQYLKEFFALGIEIGRFKEFNAPAVSLIFLSSRLFVAQSVTIDPEKKKEWSDAQQEMFNELSKVVPFTY